MAGWALDLGTTNSGISCWDESLGKPRLVETPDIGRNRDSEDPLEAPRLVPSAVHFLERPGVLDRLGSWPPLARRFFIGRRAVIGRPALERNQGVVYPSFVPTFKPALSGEPLRPLARVGRESLTARDAAHAFLRELLREVKRTTGQRVRDLVVTSPMTAFEMYRAEAQHRGGRREPGEGDGARKGRTRRRRGPGSGNDRRYGRRAAADQGPSAQNSGGPGGRGEWAGLARLGGGRSAARGNGQGLLARPGARPGHAAGHCRDPIPPPGCLAGSVIVGRGRVGPVVAGHRIRRVLAGPRRPGGPALAPA